MQTIKNLFRYWMLCACENILGDDIEPEEQKLLATCYKKLLEKDREIEEKR